MTVLSVQKHSITLAAASATATADLTGTPTIANCVPFLTSRITAMSSQNNDEFQDYTLRADFLTSPDRVQIQTDASDITRAMVGEVTVVEFDPTYVNVYSGTDTIANGSQTEVVSAAFGGSTVDLTKAWLYFTFTSSSSADVYINHTVRGRITANNELTFDHADTGGATVEWYVVECKNTEWSVDPVDIQLLATTGTTGTDTITALTTTDRSKAFVLGSHRGSTTNDGPEENLVDVVLTNSTTVTATRQVAGAGQIDWSGFVVEFASGGNENVYRGTLAWGPPAAASTTDTISTAVTIADSMVHLAGQTGVIGGGHWKDTENESSRVPDAFTAWTITGTTQVTVTHSQFNNDADQDLSWEVIEWDVGAAAPAARKVMVR